MASGKQHDCSIAYTTPIYGLAAAWLTGSVGYGLLSAIAFLWSGFWLSPDLDIHSDPYKRWLILRWCWLPYQKLIPHRSVWSHGIGIGSQLRILYVCAWLALLGFGGAIVQLVTQYPKECLVLAIACEASALVHLFMDCK
ncbi:MAG: metal-binding protein [Cyanobacteria bacterium J06638_20]